MARDAVIDCPAGEYTQLTDADVSTNISIEVLSEIGVELIATADATQPAATERGNTLPWRGNGWSKATIEEMFPGVAGAVRLWAKPYEVVGGSAQVRISYA